MIETVNTSRDETLFADNYPPEAGKSPQRSKARRKTPSLIQCSGCENRWSGLSAAHCSACHRTFTGITAFDIHRVGSQCTNPADILGRDGQPRLAPVQKPYWSGWGYPSDDTRWSGE